MLKGWNLSLIIIAFSLTIFGTFLTRSGILSSIHAFSSGPVGMLFLSFLALVVLGSFGLLAWRADRLREQPELDAVVSRESVFLLNNVVLVSALFTIFLGTIFPLPSEAVAGVKVSVGAPYFTRITTPLFLALVFLMGVGPVIAWRKASLDQLRRNFLGPAALALAVGLALFAWRVRDFWPLLAVAGPIVGLLALLGYGLTRNPREIPTPLLAKPAASFTLALFDGHQLSLEELRGKVVFLNFWASWCPPCRAEARTLEAAWQKYKDRDVMFLGVNIQDTEAAARAFLQEFGTTYPNGRDSAGRIAIDYGVWGLPETFIIDREGRITYKHIGALEWTTITTKLDEALRGIISTVAVVAVSSQEGEVLYMSTFSSDLYQSGDGGKRWQPLARRGKPVGP